MHDLNQLLRQLGGGSADPELLRRLQTLTEGQTGQALTEPLRTASAEELRQAVQRGNAGDIRAAVGQFLATPEGMALADRLRQALGK